MMDGLATATMVASTRIMKKPTIIAQSAVHGFAAEARRSCRSVSVWNILGRLDKYVRVQPTLRTMRNPDKSGSPGQQASGRFGDDVADDSVLCTVRCFGRRHADRQ